MKRRAAKVAVQEDGGHRLIRVHVQDVYGGMIPARGQENGSLALLAESIARRGLLQPIIVRKSAASGRYALVCGARRLAACRMLGMKEIDALCVDMDEQTAVVCFMEEHLARCAPCAMDEAQALSAADEDALSACPLFMRQEMALRKKLLGLPERVQEIVRQKGLSLQQALPLLRACGEARQTEAALIIAERALTPAQARRLVFGPERETRDLTGGRRRTVRAALEEVNAMAKRLRAQGVEASVSVHSQEGGMCVQILLAHGEKRAGQQEFEKKPRNN